ncbi:MAG: GNAT family N-acetyltransferase [Armatimonadetes bacterium]|nr:GNAT family N-acetyltransferase [Armatimonadota bacterium]
MTPETMQQFPAITTVLKDGTQAIIRPLMPEDGEALGDLYESMPREDVRFYFPHQLDRAHALANAAKAFSPLEVVLVLETPAQRVAGYAWYRWTEEDASRSVFGICIGRACQGRGAGRALMTRLAQIAEKVGPPVMTLTVQEANPRAVALYQSMGFSIVRAQIRQEMEGHGFPPEPEYLMERRVR